MEPTLLGGEMTGWEDGIDPPTALTTWVASTLDRVNGTVLLIGPRASLVAAPLGDRATVVVRGSTDAGRLASQGVRVLCGGLDRITLDAYDTVVLLDPPERVLTPDSPGLSHVDILELAAARSSGRTIAFLPNALSIQSISQHHGAGDEAWWVGSPGYDPRRPVLVDLPTAPSWLVLGDLAVARVDRVDDPSVKTTLSAAFPTHEHWLDAIRATTLPQLASGWVLLSGDALPDSSAVFAPSLQHPHPASATPGDISGDTAGVPAGWTGSTTAGDPLEVLLGSALRRNDRGQLETLVAAYADCLQGPANDPRERALPRHLVVTADGSLACRAASDIGRLLSAPACFAVGLLDLADLVAGTNAHPFGAESDAEGVARELAAFTDRLVPDTDDWEAACELLRSEVVLSRRPVPSSCVDRPESEDRVLALETELRERQGKITYLQTLATRQERRIRALEHAIATEHGPRARRALFVMTAPTSRLVEAARGRLRRKAQ